MGEVRYLKTGEVVCNPRFRIITPDWDNMAKIQLESGAGFRITEIGKTDVNLSPGLYSIHSPLYGTDFQDDHAFADTWSCECGELQGMNYADGKTLCPKCGKPVKFVDIDLTKTGWIILDKDYIIQPTIYKKLVSFIGQKNIGPILNYVDDLERATLLETTPYYGIGMIEFKERFLEILDFFYKKNKKKAQQYIYLRAMYETDNIFMKSIPVYSSFLRQFIVRGDDIKYSKTDTLFRKIFSNVSLLNDRFILERRRESREKKKKDLSYLRREAILYRIQLDLDALWDLSFSTIDGKEGVIKDQLLGGRLNYTARNVIIPDSDLKADEVALGYITFLELYKPELIGLMKQMYDISYEKADAMWTNAQMCFSQEVYELMNYLINHRRLIITIDRNPSRLMEGTVVIQ